MVINSDQTLADFTSNDQKDLRQAVEIFEKVITERASQVKTPDAMGLVATFEDELKILDQARYDAAVLQLKALIDSLSQELNQTKLVSKIQKLLEKHAPTGQLKPIDSTKLTKKNSTKRITPVTVCESNPDQKIVLKEAQVLAKEIKRCANRQLLDLALQYQDSPTTTLKRKLQWKLSELELHMHKLAKNVELIGDCRDQVDLILNEVLQNNALVTELITVLNQINATHELKDLIKQINHHSLIIRF